MSGSESSQDFLHSTQESAATNQTVSSAGQDLSRRQREAADVIASSSRAPRRSERLQPDLSDAAAELPHIHGYHTRSQPLSNRQLRAAHGNPIPMPKSEPSSPSVPIGRKQKGYSRLSAKQKAKKQEAEEARQKRLESMQQRLEDDNPLDELSMDMKKRLASYLVLKDVFEAQGSKERAEIEARVAHMLGFSARTISIWSREYELAERLDETLTLRGKHPKTKSPIGNPEFEDFRQRLRTFVRTEAVGKGGKPNLTVHAITQWINEELDLDHNAGYSDRTVSRWLELLNFKVVTVKKTLYVDGHERSDVIADRARLAKQLDEVHPLLLTVDPQSLEIIPNLDAKFILVSQDEKIHHSNDQQTRYWSDGSYTVLPKKSQGRTVMTSDFLSEIYGFIKFPSTSSYCPGKRVGSLLDVSQDGYYDSDKCLADFEECSKAVSACSGGKLKCVFLTDRSPIHCKMADDALNVRLMNVRPGGKQPKMRDGWFWEEGQKKVQSMVFPSDHPVYPGQPKGLRQVCTERFGVEAVFGLKHEGLVNLLKDCEDFRSQPTLLQDQARARGDLVIYGVKFHPELAPIEAAYRSIAKALRVANSATSSAGFKARVAECQDPPDLTSVLIRKHFRSAREYLQLYTEGKTLEEIEHLRKVKRKHRGAAPQLGEAAPVSEPSKPGKYPRYRL